MNLKEGKSQQEYRIIEISLSQSAKKRLAHVGIYEGAHIKIERQGHKDKPSLLFVCGNFLMMRADDLAHIQVERV